jgi:alpha-ketoglutarate-dependent taurine dioxygenase
VSSVCRGRGRRLLDTLYAKRRIIRTIPSASWEPDTVGIWDNYATQHLAVADHYPQARMVQRAIAEAGARRISASRSLRAP